MNRDMKFHIYNMEHEPLCWEDKAWEFDTFKAALRFLYEVDAINADLLANAAINEDILYYDGGYVNATNLTVVNDELVIKED